MDDDVIIMTDDDDGGPYRNAVVVRGGRDHRSSDQRYGGSTPNRGPQIIRVPSRQYPQYPTTYAPPRAPVVEPTTVGKAAEWIPDVIRGLAAMLPLPSPPNADPDVGTNISNLLTYFGGLATAAQRKEALHTLASIAERHL